ncbi:MAG: tetratricopeptide repeat protein, partial [Acidobacteria bacterium]|nr:tetratricopeptide repeat protein [Acidobacteriota bacterium]
GLWKMQALLGMCEKRLGRPGAARPLLEQSLPRLEEGTLRAQAGLELLEILYQTRDLDKATDILRVLEPGSSTNVDLLYTAYRIYTDLAYRARDALATVAPDNARMYQLMAQHLVNQGDLPRALVLYRKALEIDPKLPGVHYDLGEAVLLSPSSDSALQEAEKEFRAALAENAGDANAEYKLGRVYAMRLDLEKAIQHYSRALKLQPEHVNAHIRLGEALMKRDEPRKALGHLVSASRLDPLNATVHYRLAMLYRALGRESEAQRELSMFKKLRDSKEKIRQVYQQMRQSVPEAHDIPPDVPKE